MVSQLELNVIIQYQFNFDYIELENSFSSENLDEYERIGDKMRELLVEGMRFAWNNTVYDVEINYHGEVTENDMYDIMIRIQSNGDNIPDSIVHANPSVLLNSSQYDLGNGKQCMISNVSVFKKEE